MTAHGSSRWWWVLSIAGSIIWLILTGVVVTRMHWSGSPDERMNDVFSQRISSGRSIQFQSPISEPATAAFPPRSVFVRDGVIAPGSFLGLPLVTGFVDRLFTGGRYAVVPLLALAGLWAVGGLFSAFWGRWYGLLGAVFVAVHPAWLTFQTIPMYHNGAFVSLLLVAGYLLKQHHLRPRWSTMFGCSVALGAALFFRPSEVLWTVPLALIVLLTMPGRWRWVAAAGAVIGLMQLPWMITSQSLYGSLFATAYTPGTDAVVGASNGTAPAWFRPAGGVGSWHFLSSVWWYLLLLTPIYSIASLAAIVVYVRRVGRRLDKVIKLSILLAGMIFVWWYYGSWDLYPLTPASRIGALASYTRYWLPFYIAMAGGVLFVLHRLQGSRWWRAAFVSMALLSALTPALTHPTAGLIARWRQQQRFAAMESVLLKKIPPETFIFAGRWDTVLFGHRATSWRLPTDQRLEQDIPNLLQDRQVVVIAEPTEYAWSSIATRLQAVGVTVVPGEQVNGIQLYYLRSS